MGVGTTLLTPAFLSSLPSPSLPPSTILLVPRPFLRSASVLGLAAPCGWSLPPLISGIPGSCKSPSMLRVSVASILGAGTGGVQALSGARSRERVRVRAVLEGTYSLVQYRAGRRRSWLLHRS